MVVTGGPPGRLRVLYLIDSLGRGGAEHLLDAYLQVLPALGIDAAVAALQERDGNPFADRIAGNGTEVRTLGIERLRQPDAYRRVAAAIDRSRPDLVHTQLEFSDILGSIAAHRRGIPTVATLHTLEEPARLTKAWARNRLTAWVLRRYADRVIAVSEHARRHHLAHLSLPARLVTTLYNGIDTGRFLVGPEVRAEVRTRLRLPADAPVIVTVAVLRPPKGIADMLAALPHILEAVPDAHYLVVGDGPALPDLRELTTRQRLADRVHFAGRRADVPRMLAAADLFVLPSHTEALPTVVAEAMAAGLPVVATRVGGTPEMVSDEIGCLVEPGAVGSLAEAVVDLLGAPTVAAQMGARARELAVDRFDIHRQAGRLVALYRDVARPRVTP